jgi:hypothetical protein
MILSGCFSAAGIPEPRDVWECPSAACANAVVVPYDVLEDCFFDNTTLSWDLPPSLDDCGPAPLPGEDCVATTASQAFPGAVFCKEDHADTDACNFYYDQLRDSSLLLDASRLEIIQEVIDNCAILLDQGQLGYDDGCIRSGAVECETYFLLEKECPFPDTTSLEANLALGVDPASSTLTVTPPNGAPTSVSMTGIILASTNSSSFLYGLVYAPDPMVLSTGAAYETLIAAFDTPIVVSSSAGSISIFSGDASSVTARGFNVDDNEHFELTPNPSSDLTGSYDPVGGVWNLTYTESVAGWTASLTLAGSAWGWSGP